MCLCVSKKIIQKLIVQLPTTKNGKLHNCNFPFLKTVKKSENVSFPTLTAILITI